MRRMGAFLRSLSDNDDRYEARCFLITNLYYC